MIHKIYWNGFLNQKDAEISNLTWKQFFEFNEYQLKIKSDKEAPMFYQFRNEVNFQYFQRGDPSPFQLNNRPIDTAQYDDYILMTPKKPVIFDTFITAYDYLNFTISRNELLPNGGINFGFVNAKANEAQVPNGVDGQLVLLQVSLVGTNGTQETLNPPSPNTTNAPLNPDTVTNYSQLLDPPLGTDNGSFLQNPQGGSRLKHSDYVTNPLLGFEYCIIQKNEAGKLSSL